MPLIAAVPARSWGRRAGLIVNKEDEFVSAAVQQIEAWIAQPIEYMTASRSAIEQAEILHREGAVQLDRVARRICCLDRSSQSAIETEFR